MDRWLLRYLEEDLGEEGDITSKATIADGIAHAQIRARQAGYLVGADVAGRVFELQGAEVSNLREDGPVAAGDVILDVVGDAKALLSGERVALNLLGRMMGIATQVRRGMDLLAGACSAAQLAGTRKTTPGFRLFEKMAIERAGGDPHRFDLSSEGMIKDNHIAAAGDLAKAIEAFQTAYPKKRLTVEVESLDMAKVAASFQPRVIMIDNQTPETGLAWAEAIWEIAPQTLVEVSGGIDLEDVAAYGWADRISLGALTHQAQSLDVGLDWEDA